MRKTLKGVIGVIVGVILASGLAKATSMTIYSNFGPGMSFDTNPADSYFVTGSSFPSTCPPSNPSCVTAEALGVQFTPSANYTFDEAQIAVFLASGTNSLGVYLEQDLNGMPGSIISEFEVSNQMTSSPAVLTVGQGQAGVTLVQGSFDPDLNAGTPYWLVLAAGAPDTEAAWSCSQMAGVTGAPVPCTFAGDISTQDDFAVSCSFNPGTGVVSCFSSPTGPWLPAAGIGRPAFEIDGNLVTPPSTVPEPGSLILMVLGLGAILVVMRGNRALHLF